MFESYVKCQHYGSRQNANNQYILAFYMNIFCYDIHIYTFNSYFHFPLCWPESALDFCWYNWLSQIVLPFIFFSFPCHATRVWIRVWPIRLHVNQQSLPDALHNECASISAVLIYEYQAVLILCFLCAETQQPLKFQTWTQLGWN